MYKLDTTVKALWISDIHWTESYFNTPEKHKETLKPFLESFYQTVRENNIDYLIITGDLSNKGENAEFQQLLQHLIDPILKIKKVPIITVPGNHDLDRKVIENNSHLLAEFIQNIHPEDKRKRVRHFREDFFQKHYDYFANVFDTYSEFVVAKLIDQTNNIAFSQTYKEHALYGYCIDKNTKMIFIMLNSSWYSFGEEFLKFFLSQRENNKDQKLSDVELKSKVKRISQITNEYGQQILGLEILNEIDKILEVTKKYPEYLTVLLMHHPINWLIRNDQIPLDDHRFPRILSNVDLLLTGHEHVLYKQPTKLINNQNTVHLEAGEFMNVPVENEPFSSRNNWFSFLDINVTKRTVQQKRIIYEPERLIWKEAGSYKLKLHKKYFIAISKERHEQLKRSIKAQPENYILRYFTGLHPSEDKKYFIGREQAIYFLELNESINESVEYILELLENLSFTTRKVFFVFFDIFHTLAHDYFTPSKDRISTLFKIKREYDLEFDNLRYTFFAKLSSAQAIKYSETMFISLIIPFWEIEHFDF